MRTCEVAVLVTVSEGKRQADAVSVIQAFCDLMDKGDPEALRPFFTADAVYQNCGMPATIGVDAIVAVMAAGMADFADGTYVMKNIAADGDVVLTERVDMIRTPNGVQGMPVMGTFVLEGGRIRRWHDYFDSSVYRKLMRGEDVSALIPVDY